MTTRSETYPDSSKGFLRRRLLDTFKLLNCGQLRLSDEHGEWTFGTDARDGLVAEIKVNNLRFYRRLALGGSVGAGESYIDGDWDTPNLTDVVRLMTRNRDLLDQMDSGLASFAAAFLKLWHRKNDNSIEGSQRNIHAHYDTSNAFFEKVLDRSMMYSCADYRLPGETLEQAQANKLQRICETLKLTRHDHVLEIGTGWGGFAEYAAKHYGCRVTTTTISQEQHDYAAARFKASGVDSQVTLLLNDYRDLDGQYDKLVSIEMVEAVGENYLDGYFETIHKHLKPGAQALIQAITIEDWRYEQAVRSVDFMKRHVFPGSFIPCVSVLTDAAAKSKLRLAGLQDIGSSYAGTLKAWNDRMFAAWPELTQMGFDQTFKRLWHFYFCYCEGGYREGALSDVQLLFTKSRANS
ncbi:MAG: cyclopropane-fatty-acyl-phospholipid synthase [Lysobacteraceae bacterium]|nr:MAG: cyclopropane-fatty-acyl-phospholipid synthase [Xanthomonadaceae bacterium]